MSFENHEHLFKEALIVTPLPHDCFLERVYRDDGCALPDYVYKCVFCGKIKETSPVPIEEGK